MSIFRGLFKGGTPTLPMSKEGAHSQCYLSGKPCGMNAPCLQNVGGPSENHMGDCAFSLFDNLLKDIVKKDGDWREVLEIDCNGVRQVQIYNSQTGRYEPFYRVNILSQCKFGNEGLEISCVPASRLVKEFGCFFNDEKNPKAGVFSSYAPVKIDKLTSPVVNSSADSTNY